MTRVNRHETHSESEIRVHQGPVANVLLGVIGTETVFEPHGVREPRAPAAAIGGFEGSHVRDIRKECEQTPAPEHSVFSKNTG